MATQEELDKVRMVTTEFRASHPHVFKATKINPTDKPRFSIEMLFDKTTTKLSEFQTKCKNALIAKWGPDQAKWPKPLALPYRDGDKPYGKKREVKPEHVGMWVIRASTLEEYGRPYVVGRDPEVHLTTSAEFYPGCYARAALKANAYDVGKNQGVSFILDGVQFIRDGEALGSKRPANQVFGIIEGDAGSDELDSEEIPF